MFYIICIRRFCFFFPLAFFDAEQPPGHHWAALRALRCFSEMIRDGSHCCLYQMIFTCSYMIVSYMILMYIYI